MSSPTSPASGPPPVEDARHRLCGLLAAAELAAFQQLATDAALAPTLGRRAAVLEAAGHRLDQHRALVAELDAADLDPIAAMTPYMPLLDDFHARTSPRGWPEALVKAWVYAGLAHDWYAAVADGAAALPVVAAELRVSVDGPEWIGELLRQDPAGTGRLTLWTRRLVGEGTTCLQRLAAEDDALTDLVTDRTAAPGTGMAELHVLIASLLKRHDERLTTVGLMA